MTAAEIRRKLLDIIQKIEDEAVLREVYKLISEKADPIYSTRGYQLSEEEFKANIEEAENDITEGKVHTHDDVVSRLKLRF